MRVVAVVVLTLGCVFAAAVAPSAVTGPRSIGFGVVGDSDSDEYRADDGRGGSYGATTFNWIELLMRYRGLDFGSWGSRDYPRRTGYANNWALSGARAEDAIAGGQVEGVAAQVAAGTVQIVVMIIGNNDFAFWNGTYQEVYDGSLSGAALTAKIDGIVSSISTAMQVIHDAGSVEIIYVPLINRGDPSEFPDAAGRQRVGDAIAAVNAGVAPLVASLGVHAIDTVAAQMAVFSRMDANGNVNVGGELITTASLGDEPHHARLADRHAGTVFNGLLANTLIDALNQAGASVAPFTDEEMLEAAGIFPDQTAPSVSLTNPVDGATVFGSISLLAQASDNVGVAGVRFAVDGAGIGSEDQSAPFSTTWSATAPGPHVIAATARDAAGNTATATANVTVLDTTPPSISISSPTGGATISGTVNISASASDNATVIGVTFYAGGNPIGDDTASPFSVAFNTTTVANGSLALTAVARDAAGNTRTSSAVTVSVNNPVPDTTAPAVTLANPVDGATVWGTVSLAATATDNVKVVGVRFRVDGATIGSEDTVAPYAVNWKTTTTTAASGTHVVTATARDAAGNSTTSTASVTVVPATTDLFPSSYTVTMGTYHSGALSSLTANDGAYFVETSALSGLTSRAVTEFALPGSSGSASSFTVNVVLKSSRSSTSVAIEAFNYSSGTWTSLTSLTVGTTKASRNVTVSSDVAAYRGPDNAMQIRVSSSRPGSAYLLSLDRLRMTVSR